MSALSFSRTHVPPSHDLRKSPICAHLCMQAHMCRHTHRDHLPIQRHIEHLHTDTQAPASPPPTTAMVTVQTVPLKTQSQRRHIDVRLVPGAGIYSLFFFRRINMCCGILQILQPVKT